MSTLSPISAPIYGQQIAHGFFGRAGGVSTGLYRGLNCGLGSDDNAAHVVANRARVADAMGLRAENLLTVHQAHSPDVLNVSTLHNPTAAPKADAMVTTMPDVGLAILTADCAPILLADESAGVIGAAHAGWKGAAAGVLEKTVAAMETLGAARKQIKAVIGPTISQTNYEVGPEFKDRFMSNDAANEKFFVKAPKDGHHLFDLPAFCVAHLRAAGVGEAHHTSMCTYGDEATFYSYRRATHRSEPDYGRNISVIVLRP